MKSNCSAIRAVLAREMIGFFLILSATCPVWGQNQPMDPVFELRTGDRIAIIGNTLAERLQYDGWLEAILHNRFPEKNLVIRNFGFSGDEIDLRLRSKGFGTPDDHLGRFRASVVVMMFGFGESFEGPEGVAAFEASLNKEIERVSGNKYDGDNHPRIVLVTPSAIEDLGDPNLPDPEESNLRISVYAEAIQRVAESKQIPCVDLFQATRKSFEDSRDPLTINGVHLTSDGNRAVALSFAESLFGVAPSPDEKRIEQIRSTVLDKNFYWFNCYRTTDGFSIFGDRGELGFVGGQTNREVMTRELEILSMMADNRDPVIWGAARGEQVNPDDSNLPPRIPVVSNIPGDLPDGSHTFLDPETAMTRMRLPEGYSVSLFASEADFPELVNPVQMAFDTRGRLWVAVWPTYPHWVPGTEMNDKLLILEDTDNNGRADKCTVFADKLHNPTGFEFWGGGVLVAAQPNILFLADTDGDDRVDIRRKILHGIDSADTHHAANSFVFGPDGALYFQEGTFHHTQVETPWGLIRSANAASYRFEPSTWRLSVYTPYGYANPHGHVFDLWGNDILHDGTSSNPYDAALTSGHLDFPAKHPGAPLIYRPRTRPCPATEIVSAGNFPAETHGELLVGNVIGDLGILRYRISENGASFRGEELEPLILSSDPRFRPVDLEFAPDGTLFFVDWHNPIIGHMQHNLRDPNRDRSHGRVYQIRYAAAVQSIRQPADLSTAELLTRLVDPETSARDLYRTRIELTARKVSEVKQELDTTLSRTNSGDDRRRLLLLWLAQQINDIRPELLKELAGSSDYRVRSAVMRIASDWVGRAPESASVLLQGASDENPRVRMLAARGASFVGGDMALQIIATVASRPTDEYIDYVVKESMRVVPGRWKSKLADNGLLDRLDQAGQVYLLGQLDSAQLARIPVNRTNADFMALRAGVSTDQRAAAVRLISETSGRSIAATVVALMRQAVSDSGAGSTIGELGMMLGMQSGEDLVKVRGELASFVDEGNSVELQRAGWLGLALADDGVESALKLASTPRQLASLASTLPLIPVPRIQQALFDHLTGQLPAWETSSAKAERIAVAKKVRIELPGQNRILTLAEVEVITGGVNVAPEGTATQISTSHGGDASRGIDGNTNGIYASGGQTHSTENISNPWWQVELAQPSQIESIRIHNRTEGDFYRRLDGFSVIVLDRDDHVVFRKDNIGATREPMTIVVQAPSQEELLVRATLDSISSVRSRGAIAFSILKDRFLSGTHSDVAARSLLRIQPTAWDPAAARELAGFVLQTTALIPAEERDSDYAGRLFQIGQMAAGMLPVDERKQVMAELSAQSIPVLNIGTRPHRMEYDRTVLAIEPGRRFAIVFENTDQMPHNLVLINPGRLESIGTQAEAESMTPEGAARGYVPQSPDVLAATILVQPGQSDRIALTAPTKPGIYPYVCTYPGHWRRMFGALYVVPDTAAFFSTPDAYAEANGLRIEDELLRLNAQRREWKISDFEEDFANGNNPLKGRDFVRGKELFRSASCASCHKMAGEGYELGADLAEIDPTWSQADLLRHILVPSEKIDDKYRTQILLTLDGETISGIVTNENKSTLVITDNPLQQTSARTIAIDDIDARSVSDVSMMPVGLLDTLSHGDILDLMAYIVSKGKEDSPNYTPEEK